MDIMLNDDESNKFKNKSLADIFKEKKKNLHNKLQDKDKCKINVK